MKKKMFVCAIIAICASIVAYGTTAYFTHHDTATNVITAGNIKIDLQEWAITDGGGAPLPDIPATLKGKEEAAKGPVTAAVVRIFNFFSLV